MQKSIDSMQKSIEEIKEMLKESIKTSSSSIGVLEERITNLELEHKVCPINRVESELKNISRETKFIRLVFSDGWKGTVILTLWVVLIFILIALLGPKDILEFILKFRA